MAGTKAGGMAAAKTNKLRHGEDFYSRIGAQGGKNGHTGGFQKGSEAARIAGALGGRKSRRGFTKKLPDGGNPASRPIHDSDLWPERQNNEAIFNFHTEPAPYTSKKKWWQLW